MLEGLEPQQQAEYLTHFRADSIVRDAELVREALGVERWSVLGQSFGGFCVLTYLSFFPQSLREAFFTGGLPPVGRPTDDVYSRTYPRVVDRCRQFYERYPDDRARVRSLVRRSALRCRPLWHGAGRDGRSCGSTKQVRWRMLKDATPLVTSADVTEFSCARLSDIKHWNQRGKRPAPGNLTSLIAVRDVRSPPNLRLTENARTLGELSWVVFGRRRAKRARLKLIQKFKRSGCALPKISPAHCEKLATNAHSEMTALRA